MRFDLFFLAMVSAHLIGDYYLQTDEMAQLKKESLMITVKHGLYYALPFLLLPLLFSDVLGLTLLAIMVHFFIDLVKYQMEKKNKHGWAKRVQAKEIYVLDQMVHLLSLFFISGLVSTSIHPFMISLPLNTSFFLGVLPAILFLFKPANITFKLLFGRFSPEEKDLVSIKGAGAVIGSLERLLMLIFLSLGQFSAVGLIMTAKSIARYDKISKDPVFAEYYLIGTLYSILVTVFLYLFFLH